MKNSSNDLKSNLTEGDINHFNRKEYFMKKHINDFLKNYSIEDIKAEIIGELNEYSTDAYTAFFGNRELIISTENEEITYVVDTIGFNDYLIELILNNKVG